MNKKIVMLENLYNECILDNPNILDIRVLAEVIEEKYDQSIREYIQDPLIVGQMMDVFGEVLERCDFSSNSICINLYRENPELYIRVINRWFRPYRFGLEYLYIEAEYYYKMSDRMRLCDYEFVKGYYKIPIDLVPRDFIGRLYWFPQGDTESRKDILRKAIELLFEYHKKG